MIRRLLAAWIALIAVIWLGAGHAQFNGCPTGFCSTRAPAGGGGVVTFCAIGPENAGAGAGNYFANSSSFSITANINAGTCTPNPGAVCIISRASATLNALTGLGITWNAVSMTLVHSKLNLTTNNQATAIFGIHNPATGSQTVQVTATNAAADNIMNCIWFSNVNQTSDAAAFPNSADNGGSNVASVAVTSASGHYGVGSWQNTGSLGTALGTSLYSNAISGSIINAAGDYIASVGATVTVGTTAATQPALVGIDVSN